MRHRAPPLHIRDFLSYDPETGEFRWVKTASNRAKAGVVAGCIDKHSGYIYVAFEGRLFRAHRLAWWWVHGDMPPLLDHRDRDRTNNAIANLRPADGTQNNANARLRRNNTSGFRGVYLDRRDGRWQAEISVYGRKIALGRFDHEAAAARAYDAAALRHFGEFARINLQGAA